VHPESHHVSVAQLIVRHHDMRRIAIILGSLVVTLFAVVVALIVIDNPKARVSAIQECFDEMPNVRVTYISDLTKQASQVITAHIEVNGKGEIGFTGLSPSSFTRSSRIRLHGIGPYGFRTRQLEKGQEAYGYDIDIGTASPIPAMRQLGITSIQSAVAHYDELLALVSGWPVTTNEWPRHWPPKTGEWSETTDEEIHFPDLPRGDFYFCLKRRTPD
jgi:hypothetical protein